ncbi:MAG TPA: hypothetical protein VFA89_02725 [Terriglobales bacterium]|nr:hypothetical protein [Terriglobales bacterium]
MYRLVKARADEGFRAITDEEIVRILEPVGREFTRYASYFGALGGKLRAKKLSPERRKQIAKKAAAARWARRPKK